jgi:hypothetical protein
MEVKINREIREYTESIFFGLSLRQSIFSFLAIAMAVVLGFAVRGKVSTEVLSWICIFGAIPFALMGFLTYHGMTAEQFAWAWLRSQVLEPHRYCNTPQNIYYQLLKDHISVKEKEELEKHDEIYPQTPGR